jgi:hypothetical protein
MTNLEKRLARLSGRVTHEAWNQLLKSLNHPRFPEILSDLERVDGTLDVNQIQHSLARFLERRRHKR